MMKTQITARNYLWGPMIKSPPWAENALGVQLVIYLLITCIWLGQRGYGYDAGIFAFAFTTPLVSLGVAIGSLTCYYDWLGKDWSLHPVFSLCWAIAAMGAWGTQLMLQTVIGLPSSYFPSVTWCVWMVSGGLISITYIVNMSLAAHAIRLYNKKEQQRKKMEKAARKKRLNIEGLENSTELQLCTCCGGVKPKSFDVGSSIYPSGVTYATVAGVSDGAETCCSERTDLETGVVVVRGSMDKKL